MSVGVAVAMGFTLMNGGSSGSAQTTCRRLPNHCLILSMRLGLPARRGLHRFYGPCSNAIGFCHPQVSGLLRRPLDVRAAVVTGHAPLSGARGAAVRALGEAVVIFRDTLAPG